MDAGGFNREEGIDSPDNSVPYIEAVNQGLAYWTLNQVQLKSFVQDMDKIEIIKTAVALGIIWIYYGVVTVPEINLAASTHLVYEI